MRKRMDFGRRPEIAGNVSVADGPSCELVERATRGLGLEHFQGERPAPPERCSVERRG